MDSNLYHHRKAFVDHYNPTNLQDLQEYLKIHFKHKENAVTSGLNSFFLKIKDYNILQISFINDIDQEVVMDISNFERNVSIKDSNFKFKIPNNADVLLNN